MSRKVTLIAPVAPFRGGIARHSEVIARDLHRRPDLDFAVESFARLYPAFLYPGQSDRDESRVIAHSFPARFDIDTMNPLSWRRVAARVAKRGGTVIIPAWTFFVAPTLGWIARRLRARGLEVAIMVHNVVDHEAASWKAAVQKYLLRAADRFVTHTADLAADLRSLGMDQPVAIAAHPAYPDFPQPEGRYPKERALELLCFGLGRNYKGYDIALDGLRLSGLEDVRLTIAGEIWEDKELLQSLAATDELQGKVEIHDRYVSDEEASEFFARCDAVLAPYRTVTGSGVAAMARYFARPMVASDLPGLSAEIEHGRNGWLFEAGNAEALASLLRSEVTRAAAEAMQLTSSLEEIEGDWARLVDRILG